MKLRKSSVAAGVAALTLSLLVNGPARAADSDITIDNSVCDFAAAGLGHGSASDPFVINSAKSLQEMQDCSDRDDSNDRSKTISAATINGDGTITFTVEAVHGAYGVGQVVETYSTDGGALDISSATVTASTATSVTVKSSITSGSTANGAIASLYDYYVLGADIDLSAAQDNSFNDLRHAAITAAAVSSGTVTYTAANTFTAGQDVFINGMGDKEFNLGHVTIDTASSSQFTVTGTSIADGTASSAGGTADAQGWLPLAWLSKFDLNGRGHTISGLTIHRASYNQGLFGYVEYANIFNLNMDDVLVDATANDSSDMPKFAAGLIAEAEYTNISDIDVSGDVISGYQFAGHVVGHADVVNIENIETSGTIRGGRIRVSSNEDGTYSSGTNTWNARNNYGNFGGVVGYINAGSIAQATSSVAITGTFESQNGDSFIVYSHGNGGIAGYLDESSVRYVTASGDMLGGSSTGGAFGMMDYNGELIHGTATGDVTAISNNGWDLSVVGGFAGTIQGESGTSYLSSTGAVSATMTTDGTGRIYRVGGLAGYQFCCGATSHVTTSSDVTVTQNESDEVYEIGGLFGADDCCDVTTDAHATGDVTITAPNGGNVYDVGGLLGAYWCCGAYRDSDATGNVTVTTSIEDNGVAYKVGGLIGEFDCCGAITGSHSTGNVTVNNGYEVGGLVGWVSRNTALRDVYSTGDVTVSYDGDANVGGLIGYIEESRVNINRAWATGDVNVTPVTTGLEAGYVGGLIGHVANTGAISIVDSYYYGSVTGSDYVGGFIGFVDRDQQILSKRNYVATTVDATATSPVASDPVSNGNWIDSTGTNFFDSTLAGSTANNPGFNAATTANMKLAATFEAEGWVFSGDDSGWRIAGDKNDGYPNLVVPANDDSSVTNPADAPSEEPTPSPSDGGTSATVYKALKSIKFKGNATALTKANKKTLRAVAKTIAASDYKVIVLRGRPVKTKVEIAAKRQRNIYVYLTKQLSKLDASKTIRMEYKIKSKNKATNIIKILGGK